MIRDVMKIFGSAIVALFSHTRGRTKHCWKNQIHVLNEMRHDSDDVCVFSQVFSMRCRHREELWNVERRILPDSNPSKQSTALYGTGLISRSQLNPSSQTIWPKCILYTYIWYIWCCLHTTSSVQRFLSREAIAWKFS